VCPVTSCPECGTPIHWLARLLGGPGPCGQCLRAAVDRRWLARDAELVHARKERQKAIRAYLAEKYPEDAAPRRNGTPAPAPHPADTFRRSVADLLVKQLGHQRAEANALITEALAKHPEIRTADALVQAVYTRHAKPP
jgi:hypothetical protein